ncbi:MAG: hypothetical protein PHH85_02230 [Candidatus Methanoperedens sp.]|nr:hypothetical protein [Candidatus Methanoperedens sp.]
MAKSGPKGPRAKVRRVLLIEGHPDCLFNKVPRDFYALNWKATVYQLGKCGDALPKALKDMNSHAIITSERRDSSRPAPLPESLRASVKKVGDNTHITVSAVDDRALNEEIDKICEYLESLGLRVIERCHWTCDYDPGSKQAKALPTPRPTPYPTGYDLTTGKVRCGVYKKTMLFPRDCDICMMKKQCGTYAEMKEKIAGGK